MKNLEFRLDISSSVRFTILTFCIVCVVSFIIIGRLGRGGVGYFILREI